MASTGRVDLPTFYARRARRLLPAASLTLVAIGLAAYLWMPPSTWTTTAADMAASTLYAENWMLVRRSVDYLAQDQTPSPLQHFWSLAVEEQFYLGWPLLVGGVAALWRRRVGAMTTAVPELTPPPPPCRAYALPMGTLCGLSIAAGLYYARASPAAGYFMTHTRLHELGLGGLLGVWAARTPAGPHAGVKPGNLVAHPSWHWWPRTLCASTGLVAIGASGFLFNARLPFPGAAALVPVLGAVAVIAAGEGVGSVKTHALAPVLAHPWLQYVGDISYSLYLAHWPVVVMYPFITGHNVDGAFADGVTVLVLSWALAHACKCKWEDRFRARGESGDDQQSEQALPCVRQVAQHDYLKGGLKAPQLNEGTVQAAPQCKVIMPGLLFGHRRSPIAGAALMASLMATATLSASIALHRRARSRMSADGDNVRPDLAAIDSATAVSPLLNSSATLSKAIGCADFFGTNASRPYPGADAALYGCRIFNSLPISDALASMNDARHGRVKNKPYPNAMEPVLRQAAASRGQIIVMGDSHARDWVSPFMAVGKRLGFNVTNRAKTYCPPSLTVIQHKISKETGASPYLDCHYWIAEGVDMAVRERPLAVVFVAYSGYGPANKSANATTVAAGVVQAAKRIVAADIPVLFVKTTPIMPVHVPDCLAKEVARESTSTDASACSIRKTEGLEKVGRLMETAASTYPLMRELSFDDIFCANETCAPVIGNVVVYRDTNHLTQAFAQSLASALEGKLKAMPFLG